MSLRIWIACVLVVCVLASCGTAAPTSTPTMAVPASGVTQAPSLPCDCGAKADRVGLVTPTIMPSQASTSVMTEGLLVYKKFGCGSCHALRAANTGAGTAPPSDGIGARAVEQIATAGYSGHATSAAAYIRESITEPDAYYVKGFDTSPIRMPRYVNMTETELEALVQMLLQQ